MTFLPASYHTFLCLYRYARQVELLNPYQMRCKHPVYSIFKPLFFLPKHFGSFHKPLWQTSFGTFEAIRIYGEKVGINAISLSNMISIVSLSNDVPCSIVDTPDLAALRIPTLLCEWAAVFSPFFLLYLQLMTFSPHRIRYYGGHLLILPMPLV